jgi:archaellum component FlaD/FlaE
MQHMQTLAQAGRIAQQEEQKIPMLVGVPYGQSMPQNPNQPSQRPMQMPNMPIGPANNMESLVTVLEWVKYLVDKAGYNEAMDILKYLVQLGWITPDAHEALLKYIEKSTPQGALSMPKPGSGDQMVNPFAGSMFAQAPRPQLRPESKVVFSPSRIPTPEDFIRSEYRVPIQPSNQAPMPMPQAPPQPMYQMPYRGEYGQYAAPQRPEPRKPLASAIIPLTEVGQDIDSLAIILEWIRYLVDRAGTQGTKDIFEYYLNIGWVDKKVSQQLVKYVEGIKGSDEETVGYQPTVEDHATSLFFISKLKHLDLSEEEINSMLGK